jgi:hypothetical protein
MADEKQPDGDAKEPENDEKLLDDLEVDEETDVRGGRRAGGRLNPKP